MMTSQLATSCVPVCYDYIVLSFLLPWPWGQTFDQAEIIMNSTVLLVCQAMTN